MYDNLSISTKSLLIQICWTSSLASTVLTEHIVRIELCMKKYSWPFMKASISALSSGRPTPLMTSSRCFHVGETELRPAHHWDINFSTYSSDWLCGSGGVTPDRLASWETWLARTDTIWIPITASSLVRSSDKNLLSGENRDTTERNKKPEIHATPG